MPIAHGKGEREIEGGWGERTVRGNNNHKKGGKKGCEGSDDSLVTIAAVTIATITTVAIGEKSFMFISYRTYL